MDIIAPSLPASSTLIQQTVSTTIPYPAGRSARGGRLNFFRALAHLAEWQAFLQHLSPVRKKRWVVYAKAPFAGPEAVLAYLSRQAPALPKS